MPVTAAAADQKDEPSAPLSGSKRRAEVEPEASAAPTAVVKKVCAEDKPIAEVAAAGAQETPAVSDVKEDGEVDVAAAPDAAAAAEPSVEPVAVSKD